MTMTFQKLLQTAASLLKAAASSPRFGAWTTTASFGLLFVFYYCYTTDAGIRGGEVAAIDHLYHIFFISTNILLTAHYYTIAELPWERALHKYYMMFRLLAIVYRVAAWSFNLVLVFNTPVYLAMLIITVAATRSSKIYGRKHATNYRVSYQVRYMVQYFLLRLGEVRAGFNRDTKTKHRDRRPHRSPED